MKPIGITKSALSGMTGKLAGAITKNWLLGLRETNPAILDMFFERDEKPYRDLLPWSGEFAGKYVTGAYYIYCLTRDQDLYQYMIRFLDELVTAQDEDGYLGVYSRECRLSGAFSQEPGENGKTWDAWAHYHAMFGLLLWYGETKKAEYMACVEKMAALFRKKFYNPQTGNARMVEIGCTEMNLAPYHGFALLYNQTGKKEYLDFALELERDIADPNAGNYLEHALAGREFYQCPKPRWESLHTIMGFAEMYRATGKEDYLRACKQIFDSILRTDVHNTGGFSTYEQALGNPYENGKIETCCVIAYNALAVEVYKLTGESRIIDFLERSHYNACLGIWSPTGRWSTYNTPMCGERVANFQQIVFQSRAGSPELNCCSVNAARAVGMISEWAFAQNDDGALVINSWERGKVVLENGAQIEVQGLYPSQNQVEATIGGHAGEVWLRIPEWSKRTRLFVDEEERAVVAGEYYRFSCQGSCRIRLEFDFSTRFEQGGGEYADKVSVLRGPLLFGCDTSLCRGHDITKLPPLSCAEIVKTPSLTDGDRTYIRLSDGITLCDFCHLGGTGSRYVTWLSCQQDA